ncbi:MAG: hypothetical protein ACP5N1_06540 [Candidatus Woesearchaeota archaeon]
MRENDIIAVKTLISNIDNSIKSRDVNSGIRYYNILRNYAVNTNIDKDVRKFAYEKGKELHSILAQMSQEITKEYQKTHNTLNVNTLTDDIPKVLVKNTKINYRVVAVVSLLLLALVGGSIFFIIDRGLLDKDTSDKNYLCNISEPFTCKETVLDISDSINDTYIILRIDQTNNSINNINIVSVSESLSDCNRIYLDNEYYISKDYNEIKIVLECDDISLSRIYSGLLLEYQSEEGISNRILSIGNEGLTNMFVIEQVNIPVPRGELGTREEQTNTYPTCDLLPENLESCSSYTCNFIHPFTEETMTREILGINGTACQYVEEMPYDGLIECNYDFNTRNVIAQFYRDIVISENQETTGIDMYNTNLATTYEFNGKMVSNPMQQAIINGQCIISGYGMSADIPECPNGTTYVGEKYHYENDTKVTEIMCSDLTAE